MGHQHSRRFIASEREAHEQLSPIAKENWEPMDPRKFGHEVSVRLNAHRPYRLSG